MHLPLYLEPVSMLCVEDNPPLITLKKGHVGDITHAFAMFCLGVRAGVTPAKKAKVQCEIV